MGCVSIWLQEGMIGRGSVAGSGGRGKMKHWGCRPLLAPHPPHPYVTRTTQPDAAPINAAGAGWSGLIPSVAAVAAANLLRRPVKGDSRWWWFGQGDDRRSAGGADHYRRVCLSRAFI